jgi:hypothetical protein
MLKNTLNQIKYAYQRVVRGYDDRIFWDIQGYFSDFIPAIKEFCEERLSEEQALVMTFNPHRKEVYEKTLELLEDLKNETPYGYVKKHNFWSYFGANIAYFWS